MSETTENFWTSADERHRKIARTFYENIEYDHPDIVTSNRLCPLTFAYDDWNTTSVKYYKYNGPNVVNI